MPIYGVALTPRRCVPQQTLRDSLLGISGALYLSVFEQPASRVFFSILLRDSERDKISRFRVLLCSESAFG